MIGLLFKNKTKKKVTTNTVKTIIMQNIYRKLYKE